ncbi:MAG: T9SS type A sorting domain-containing protein [Ignavibacteria bacterium]|nr:T9SS type A sorting domain-containing protein [Ignavibacteria bacterium]
MRKSVLSVIFSRTVHSLVVKSFLISFVFIFTSFPSAFPQAHWQNMTNTPPLSRYDDVFFINLNTGYLVSGLGQLLKTTDGGNSWTVNFENMHAVFRSVGFFDENNGVLGTLTDSLPLFRTSNGGASWEKVTSFAGSPIPKGICGINITNSDIGYGVGRYFAPPYFIKTTNKGATWVSIPVDTALAKGLVDVYFWSADSGIVVGHYARSFSSTSSNPVILYTTNGGTSFTRVYKSSQNFGNCWKITVPSKNVIYVSEEHSGAVKSTDRGLNWTLYPVSIQGIIQGIGFINDYTGWVSSNSIYKTTNGGLNWTLDPWGANVNRIRVFNDTTAFASGSSLYKFTTGKVGIHQLSTEIPENFLLKQNYPNPFNPSTNIEFNLSEKSFASLSVYDMLGREVVLLINEQLNAGYYNYSFNAENLPGGTYFYTLRTQNFSDTKKMLFVK